MASFSAVIWGVAWMVVLLNIVKLPMCIQSDGLSQRRLLQ